MFVYINIDTSIIPDYAKSLQSCLTLCDPMDYSLPGSSYPWDFPGKNTGVGCHFLLQGIFQTEGLNLGLLHCRRIPYYLSHQGSLRRQSQAQSAHLAQNFTLF